MGALDVELERLQLRLVTEPHNEAVVRRRIHDVEAAIAAEEAARAATPRPIEAAVAMEVETATLPKPRRGK